MNHWARWLAHAPPTLQRLIARVHRVSLPRACPAAERLRRLRAALCSPAAVRAVYATLDPATRAALDDLRRTPRGCAAAVFTARYGAFRSWRALARDPHPRSVAERLLLLGWVLPRPTAPRCSPRFVLAPEVRRWLPRPLHLSDGGAAPAAPLPLALRAALALLLLCASAPLATRANGTLRRSALCRLTPLLADVAPPELDRLARFLLPLLETLGLVQRHAGRLTITPGAAAFLAMPPDQQQAHLVTAWVHSAAPDAWLRRLRVTETGLDRVALRQRLVQWVQLLPPGRRLAPDEVYPALVAACGPLADAHTHGLQVVRRPPWRARSAARVWQTALREPLAWLGVVAWDDGQVYRPTAFARPDGAWRYGTNGEVTAPFGALDAAALTLAACGRWVRGDATGLTLQVTRVPGRLCAPVEQVLTHRAGPPPAAWGARLTAPTLRCVEGLVLLAEAPDDLMPVLRLHGMRRAVTRLAPGIALVKPEGVAAARRMLARQGIAVERWCEAAALPAVPLTPGECAALLVACAFYRERAPHGMPLLVDATLEARLWRMLPPPVRAGVEAALALLEAPAAATAERAGAAAEEGGAGREMPVAAAPSEAWHAEERERAGVADGGAGREMPVTAVWFDLPPHAGERECAGVADNGAALAPPIAAAAPSERLHAEEHVGAAVADNGAGLAPPEALHAEEHGRTATAAVLRTLRRALARQRLVIIDYERGGAGEVTRRTVRPLALERRAEGWYLHAWCVHRRAERTFRLDRVWAAAPAPRANSAAAGREAEQASVAGVRWTKSGG